MKLEKYIIKFVCADKIVKYVCLQINLFNTRLFGKVGELWKSNLLEGNL